VGTSESPATGSHELTLADVSAGVGASIAAYTQALDDGRTDDIVATFCPDGACDIPGLGHHTGHDALRAAYDGVVATRPQRHLVLNTLITEWDDQEARATSDLVFLLKGESGWTAALVGRYRDVLHRDGGTWRFHSRVAEFTA
jgi:SnoaL-like domain